MLCSSIESNYFLEWRVLNPDKKESKEYQIGPSIPINYLDTLSIECMPKGSNMVFYVLTDSYVWNALEFHRANTNELVL